MVERQTRQPQELVGESPCGFKSHSAQIFPEKISSHAHADFSCKHMQKKDDNKERYKIIARVTLGVCVSAYLFSGLFLLNPPVNVWLFRALIIIAFACGFKILSYMRNRYTYNPCSDCPLGTFPTCEWNMPRLLNENSDINLRVILQNQSRSS